MKAYNTPPANDNRDSAFDGSALHSLLDAATRDIAAAPTLTAMVLILLPLLRNLGLSILQAVIQHRDGQFDHGKTAPPCSICRRPLARTRNRRPITRYTLLGRLHYRRRAWQCVCCKCSEYPVDTSLDLKPRLGGHSDEFASMVTLLTTLLPNAKAMTLFEKCFGFAVSTQLSGGLARDIGDQLVTAEIQRSEMLWQMRTTAPEKIEPVPAELRKLKRIKRVYVMVDDSKIGIQEGKRGRNAPNRSPASDPLSRALREEKAKAAKAAKAGKPGTSKPAQVTKTEDDSGFRNARAILIFSESDLAGISKGRHQLLRRHIVAHVGTLEEWRKLVHMAMVDAGVFTAEEVVFIADGGAGIWEMFDELISPTRERRVVQLLDFYHAMTHLWAAGRAIHGGDTPEQKKKCRKWVTGLQTDLREGRVSNVIHRLGKLKLKGKAAEEVAKAKRYFDTHRKRMRYKWARDNGMLIGSGAMESVHAWMIQPRCRLPGMRWSVAGANAMLRLRCSWACGTWDEKFAQAARVPIPVASKIEVKLAA